MISPISASSAQTLDAAAGNTSAGTSELGNEKVFLELLVAQIKNQNPLNPMDGLQFVSQLAQFSQLEQLISIRNGVDQLNLQVTSPGATGTETSPTQP